MLKSTGGSIVCPKSIEGNIAINLSAISHVGVELLPLVHYVCRTFLNNVPIVFNITHLNLVHNVYYSSSCHRNMNIDGDEYLTLKFVFVLTPYVPSWTS